MSTKCEPNISFTPDDNPIGASGIVLNSDYVGDMEFQAQFEKHLSQLINASTSLRPDSISQDYKTAFSLGPVAIGNISKGPVAFVWYCRVDNVAGKVYLARASDSNTDWNPEIELFNFTGDPVDEIDLAFDQNSNVVICAQRSNQVWLYWFKPSVLAFVFESFGVGRTPRVLLDSPLDVANSDVLLFYINDTTGNFCYRQQRDVYAIEYNVVTNPTLGDVTNKYIEDVVKHEDSRVVVIYSTRGADGKYTLSEIQSALYPQIIDTEKLNLNLLLQTLLLGVILLNYTTDTESLNSTLSLQQLLLVSVVSTLAYTLYDIEKLVSNLTLQSLSLDQVVFTYSMFDIENLNSTLALQSLVLQTIVIMYSMFDVDTNNVTLSLQSITLA